MAKELDHFNWGEDTAGPQPKYDWMRWTKGDIWLIRRGEDYEVPTENMRVNLHAKADQRGLKVRTRKVPQRGDPEYGKWEGLVFQFYEPDQEDPELQGGDGSEISVPTSAGAEQD
jgi:hypothetical protein